MKFSPCVFAIGPGTSKGAFAAGVWEGVIAENFAEPVQERRVLHSLRGIHTSSSGAPTSLFPVAALLTHDPRVGTRGADIYPDHLTEDKFLHLSRIPRMVVERIRLLFRSILPPPQRVTQIVDIPYLMDIIRQKLPPDFVERLRGWSVPFFVNVFNRQTRKVETINLNTASDPLKVVQESIAAIPGYSPPPNQTWVDAAVAEGFFHHTELRENYPDAKILYVMNHPPLRGIRAKAQALLEHVTYGMLSIPDRIGLRVFLECLRTMKDRVRAIQNDARRACLIYPAEHLSLQRTTERSELEALRAEGREKALKALQFLRAE